MRFGSVIAAMAIALSACQQAETPAKVEPATQDKPVTAATPDGTANPDFDASEPGVGNEYFYLDLLELRDGDFDIVRAAMSNIGGCNFKDADGRTLLSAGSPDGAKLHSFGVARPNGKGARLFKADKPGFAFLEAGPVMVYVGDTSTMEPLTLTVKRAEGEGTPVGVESMAWDAQLIVNDPNGARAPYTGKWSCGV